MLSLVNDDAARAGGRSIDAGRDLPGEAAAMLAAVLEAEVDAYSGERARERDCDGRALVSRNCHPWSRKVQPSLDTAEVGRPNRQAISTSGSCKRHRCLTRTVVPGLHGHPGWSGRWR